MDLNCGYTSSVTKQGMGTALLRDPHFLAKLVYGIASQSEIPVTVKIEREMKTDVNNIVKLLTAAGAATVTVHGHTVEQRHSKPADWNYIQGLASSPDGLPLIGNGDVLTFYEAKRHLKESGCLAVMVGRGALIRPWLFKEFNEERELHLTAIERVSMYRRLYSLMKEHFGEGIKQKKKAWYYAPWHHLFFHKYRELPESLCLQQSLVRPLIMERSETLDQLVGEVSTADQAPLESLLRCSNEFAHDAIASVLWDSNSDAEAVLKLEALQKERGEEWAQSGKQAKERRKR
ncbi:hypothetical protein CEUSTIGMA_g7397.t1 [Chlamydomonas eustigma]|uniref:tRNA-dihydrouridine(47) synthase [NAD(P)(+)] n=1 Tax=Chlamydomonas eustigma TaxID=1157962 RepID=A0A250XA51_9CHLO|nr:hypothetical protein CEUSTIGMA_g7397.t1 [Chlamydomonas eustigma]|eukprot:GAX79958.1 hypothetical protein CEUSTIGMA_g7397.t1 [Chlamydomonas eustigma]